MILVLMGDQRPTQARGFHAQFSQPKFYLPGTESSVDQEPRPSAFNHQRIARASATQRGQPHPRAVSQAERNQG